MTAIETPPEDFAETLATFTDRLGYRLELITPADDPTLAVLSLDGRHITLRRTDAAAVVTTERSLTVPALAPTRVIATLDDASWVTGRAGMRYRDLIPSRLGGRFIASHIEVCDGGPVPDLVHHHAIRFQLILCQRGWVDVVYEDQGPAFRMHAGDAVLQPPHIRHKVLASSAGARVVEIGCPAEHDTLFDHDLTLPTDRVVPDRDFGGQRFVRHIADGAPWVRSRFDGFEAQITAIAAATDGLADVRVLRPADGSAIAADPCGGEFHFVFALAGTADMTIGEQSVELTEGVAITLAPDDRWTLDAASDDLRLLEVRLPG